MSLLGSEELDRRSARLLPELQRLAKPWWLIRRITGGLPYAATYGAVLAWMTDWGTGAWTFGCIAFISYFCRLCPHIPPESIRHKVKALLKDGTDFIVFTELQKMYPELTVLLTPMGGGELPEEANMGKET